MTNQGNAMNRRQRRRQMLQASQQQELANKPTQLGVATAKDPNPNGLMHSRPRLDSRNSAQASLRLNLKHLLSGQTTRNLLPPSGASGKLAVPTARTSAIAPTLRQTGRNSALPTTSSTQRSGRSRETNSIDNSL